MNKIYKMESVYEKMYLLNILLVLFLIFSITGCKKQYKHSPVTKEELQVLVDNESIYLGDIDTSKITDMSKLFFDSKRKDFKGIEKWNVSNVTNMYAMFIFASMFNEDISDWNVSNVKDMSRMFDGAESFNSDVSNWNVSQIEDMSYLFHGAKKFYSNLDNWNTAKVKYMEKIFTGSPLADIPPA